MYYPDGGSYEGEWFYDSFNGQGEYLFPNNCVYRG